MSRGLRAILFKYINKRAETITNSIFLSGDREQEERESHES
jgi:hypothetical protein